MKTSGWSAENIVFGMGGGLLQKIDRDVQRFAFKCSAQIRESVWCDVFKAPLEGNKNSKRGRLVLLKHDVKGFETFEVGTSCAFDGFPENGKILNENDGCMKVVFENGKLMKEYTFAEARKNAAL